MAVYAIAFRLNKFPSEIMDRPIEEIRAMYAFLEVEHKEKEGK